MIQSGLAQKVFSVLLSVTLASSSSFAAPKNKYINSSKRGWWIMSATVPDFGNSKLGKFATADLMKQSGDRLKGFRKDIPEKPWHPVTAEITPSISLISPELISVDMFTYYNFGGAHPNSDHLTSNFGMINGKATKLTLGSLMKIRMAPEAFATQLLMPKLKARNLTFIENGDVTSLTIAQANNFVITKSGIAWIFSRYEVASYAEGDIIVKCTWEELRPYLNFTGPLQKIAPKEASESSVLIRDYASLTFLQGLTFTK